MLCSARRTDGRVGTFLGFFLIWRFPVSSPQTPPFEFEEPVREERHAHVVVEASPRAALEVIDPELLFELLVSLFDRPPSLELADQSNE